MSYHPDTTRLLIHVIDLAANQKIHQELTNHAPRNGDEIRLGGKSKEVFYVIEQSVWVYDEPDCPCARLNVGVREKSYIANLKNN